MRPLKLDAIHPYPRRGLGMDHGGNGYYLATDLCWDQLHRIFYTGLWTSIRSALRSER